MPASIPDTPSRGEPASYESALAELDRLVQAMESAQMPLDELLDRYRRGADLLAWCRGRLDAIEQQVQMLDAGPTPPWSDTP
ncbi:MAG: exodeoxyribonuclease small subunit [Pseudomonadota bacterium]|jgi:exodeoxyribonuclease VII small subunit